MACIINASTSNGLVNSADGSGQLKVQSNGVTTNALAWVNFNGTGTVAIRSSYNVSSITDNGTGVYVVNFTNALSDANYSVVATASNTGSQNSIVCSSNSGSGNTTVAPTTTAVGIVTIFAVTAYVDSPYVSVAIFGN